MDLRITCLAVTCMLVATLGAHAETPGFTVAQKRLTTGQQPRIVFDSPLPAVEGERYWITITPVDAADSVRGLVWQYVQDGATEVILNAPDGAGAFEVRLHDGYPRLSTHVVHRRRLLVWPDTTPSSSTSTKTRSNEPAAPAETTKGIFKGTRVSWKGASGDVLEPYNMPPNWTLPDVIAVEAEGKRDHLVVTLTFADDLRKTLRQKTSEGTIWGYLLTELYFDIDANEETGVTPSDAPDHPGFEVGLEISTGFEADAGRGQKGWAHGNVRSTDTTRVIGPSVTYDVIDRTPDGSLAKTFARVDEATKQKNVAIKGRQLIVSVPYAQMGLKRKQNVRVCFVDHMVSAFADGRVSNDALLTLK